MENRGVVILEMHESELETVLADMASFPRTEPFLQKGLLIREHISLCLWMLMSLAVTTGGKTKTALDGKVKHVQDANRKPLGSFHYFLLVHFTSLNVRPPCSF